MDLDVDRERDLERLRFCGERERNVGFLSGAGGDTERDRERRRQGGGSLSSGDVEATGSADICCADCFCSLISSCSSIRRLVLCFLYLHVAEEKQESWEEEEALQSSSSQPRLLEEEEAEQSGAERREGCSQKVEEQHSRSS